MILPPLNAVLVSAEAGVLPDAGGGDLLGADIVGEVARAEGGFLRGLGGDRTLVAQVAIGEIGLDSPVEGEGEVGEGARAGVLHRPPGAQVGVQSEGVPHAAQDDGEDGEDDESEHEAGGLCGGGGGGGLV